MLLNRMSYSIKQQILFLKSIDVDRQNIKVDVDTKERQKVFQNHVNKGNKTF